MSEETLSGMKIPETNERWESIDVFVAACKAFNIIEEFRQSDNRKPLGILIVEVNAFQDLLKTQGFEIKKINR